MSLSVEIQLVRIGWAYREPAWSDDHEWHLCRAKPAERQGRDIRPVYLGPENGPYIWPTSANENATPDSPAQVTTSGRGTE